MRSILFIALLLIYASCKKEKVTAGERVEIYLLKTIRLVSGKCQIDASLSVIEDTALIRNSDMLEYAQSASELKLSEAAFQKIKSLWDNTPFAVTVDRQVVYYGIYKPYISSSSCNHSITMQPVPLSDKKVAFQLGYPGLLAGAAIDDQRNNSRLLATFKSQGKLKP